MKAPRTERPSDSAARHGRVRRKCACGGRQQGECEGCKRKQNVQRKHGDARDPSTVPPIVHEVLRASGQPLTNRDRESMERRFGHSFENVRVHAGPRAAESARAINALAYTAGSHVVFGENRYSPGTPPGDRLLTHELTHVVQQKGANLSGPLTLDGPEPDAAEREAERAEAGTPTLSRGPAGIQRQPDEEIQFFDDPWSVQIPEHLVIPMGGPPEIHLELPPLLRERPSGLSLGIPPLTLTPPAMPARVIRVPRCFPDRSLTWADFQGTPPTSTFSAETHATVSKQSVGGQNMYRAILDSAASWVKPLFGDPTNRAVNNCGTPVSRCETFFNGLQAGQTGFRTFNVPASATCPASATLAEVRATSLAECETVIGANCDATRVTESDRLLAHEQGHFDITCVFSNKANDALTAGSSETAIDRTLTTKLNNTQRSYDNKTNHGCIAAQQSSWEADIAAGLPAITIP